jgi:hypothetical protein
MLAALAFVKEYSTAFVTLAAIFLLGLAASLVDSKIHAYGDRRDSAGYARSRLEQQAVNEAALKDKITQDTIDREHTKFLENRALALAANLEQREAELLAMRAARPIRMCESTDTRGATSPTGTPGAAPSDSSSSDATGSTGETGPDIRSKLVQYGSDSESFRQAVDQWQTWYIDFKAAWRKRYGAVNDDSTH